MPLAGVQGHQASGQSIQGPWLETVLQPATAARISDVDAGQCIRAPTGHAGFNT